MAILMMPMMTMKDEASDSTSSNYGDDGVSQGSAVVILHLRVARMAVICNILTWNESMYRPSIICKEQTDNIIARRSFSFS